MLSSLLEFQLCNAICTFDFIIAMCVAEQVLQSTTHLSKNLQKINYDLPKSSEEAAVLIDRLQAERLDEDVWEALLERATEMGRPHQITPSVPRVVGRQTLRNNTPGNNISQYWRRNLYLPFIDHLLQQLRGRLLVPRPHFIAQYLLPARLHMLTPELAAQVFLPFTDIPENIQAQQAAEIRRWRVRWQGNENKPTEIADTKDVAGDMYPNISVALTTLLTLPASTASAERSFSAMRRIKKYLRSTMGQVRFSSLALMHIHRDMPIDIDDVINKFATDGNRRINLVFNY